MRASSKWTSCRGRPSSSRYARTASGGNAGVAQVGDRREGIALRELLPVRAEDQAVVDVLGRARAESLGEPTVKVFVRTMIRATDDVRDLEVDVVDDRREVVRRGPVRASERDAFEPIRPESLRRVAICVLTLALTDWPLLPRDPEPLEVAHDRLLAVRDVPGGVGVVDAQEHPVAECAVRDHRQRVADVERAGRARREANAWHDASITSAAAGLRPRGPRAHARAARRLRGPRPWDEARTR